jgi:hypothetical protein
MAHVHDARGVAETQSWGPRVADSRSEEPLPPLYVIDATAPGSGRRRKSVLAATRADGYRVVAGWVAPLGDDRVVCSGRIRTADDAGHALLAAISGAGLVVEASVDRLTLDRFVDDLRRLGRVHVDEPVSTAYPTRRVSPAERRVLGMLSEGLTVAEVAQALNWPRKAVARRAAAARRNHGATSG